MNIQKSGVFVQKNRKALNLSQKELGEKLSVTDKAVSKWERGLACPDINTLKNMAFLFNCSVSEIIEGESRNTNRSSKLIQDDRTVFLKKLQLILLIPIYNSCKNDIDIDRTNINMVLYMWR